MFEWDAEKRAANLLKHGIDFDDAVRVFDGATIESPDRRQDYGEPRIKAFGEIEGVVLCLVYTWREGRRRIISARKARRDERENYRAAKGQGGPH